MHEEYTHQDGYNYEDEAWFRYREMLDVSKHMDWNDARDCALIAVRREMESLRKYWGLEFMLKVNHLKKVENELNKMDFTTNYKNQHHENEQIKKQAKLN